MKKLSIIVSMILSILLIGCANASEDTKSGEIVTFTDLSGGIELIDKSGDHYGVVVAESTELVWKDEEMYTKLVEEAKEMVSSGVIEYEYKEWEFVAPGMCVAVELGEKSPSKMHLSNDLLVECHVAKSITVTSLGETYVNPFTVTSGDL